MSEEILRIDNLPRLNELHHLLTGVLKIGTFTNWYDLSTICQGYSINLGLTFENAVKLLSELDLLEVSPDRRVRSKLTRQELQITQDPYLLCQLITRCLIKYIEMAGLLPTLFNQDTVKFDMINDSISININLIPPDYVMIKNYLFRMELAYPDRNVNSRMLIHKAYKQFFIDEVLKKVFRGSESLDIVMGAEVHPNNTPANELPVNGVKVFISYSHCDEHFRNQLKKHLSGLIRLKIIKVWYDGMIKPGEEWDISIKRNLEEANIVIFLISSDLMDSEYINNIEIQRSIDRHSQDQVKIIPILVRPCDFSSLPLSQFQVLPTGAKPITSWSNPDEAYVDIVNQFRKILTG